MNCYIVFLAIQLLLSLALVGANGAPTNNGELIGDDQQQQHYQHHHHHHQEHHQHHHDDDNFHTGHSSVTVRVIEHHESSDPAHEPVHVDETYQEHSGTEINPTLPPSDYWDSESSSAQMMQANSQFGSPLSSSGYLGQPDAPIGVATPRLRDRLKKRLRFFSRSRRD